MLKSPLLDRFSRIALIFTAVCLLGAIVLLIVNNDWSVWAGAIVLGVGVTVGIGAVFYLVGRSEDLDRAATERRP